MLLDLKAFLETVFVYLTCFMRIENLQPAGDVETGLLPTAAVLRRGRWDGETARLRRRLRRGEQDLLAAGINLRPLINWEKLPN